MNDVIQEYLVSLGFDVDQKTYGKFNQAMSGADDLIEKFGLTSVGTFAKASLAVVGFVASATVGIAKFITGLADADMEVQKFARTMWMGVDNARALKATLDVMGESLEDIAMNPELRRQFQELRTQSFQMEAPEEYKQQMKEVRSILFEIKRFQLEIKYASQWIGYYLFKYLEKPLMGVKRTLKDLNKAITITMPAWTKVVAEGLSWIARLFMTLIRVIADVVRVILELPAAFKIAGLALAALMFIFSLSPLGLFITALGAVLVLLDDFYTAMDGGNSLIPGWKAALDAVTDTFNNIKDAVDGAIQSIKDMFQLFSDAKAMFDIFDTGKLDKKKAWDLFQRGIDIYKSLNPATQGLGQGGSGLGGTPQGFMVKPPETKTINYNIKVDPTFNQYGSDPASTAGAAMSYLDSMLIRNMRGVMG